jgi:hemerythrin
MAALLVWRDVWLLDIDELDADHREMVRLLNELFGCEEASPAGAAPVAEGETEQERLRDRLEAVLTHLRSHFQREETFLTAIGYPRLEQHRREHALEMAELVDLQRSIMATDTHCLSEAAAEGIKRWFFNHVIAEDREYADFYHNDFLR